jgi:tetratricopeptide (TPR) repeat protein
MNKITKQTILSFLLLLSVCVAENLEELFLRANHSYRAEKYEEAIRIYNNILSQGFENANLYYNLGNCYFRLEQIGQSILYYEKARKINPNESDLIYNLELANLRVVDRIEIPPRFFMFNWWDKLKWYFSLDDLVMFIILLFFLVVLILIGRLFIRWEKLRTILMSLVFITSFIFLFWIYILFIRIDEYKNKVEAVILAPSVTVVSAPDENSTDMFILHEGVKILLNEQREEWVNISLADGKTGWIKNDVLGII